MAGYIIKGDPIVHSGIVKPAAGLGGGKFVTVDLKANTVDLADASAKSVYMTMNVGRGELPGDDAVAVMKKGGLIGYAKLLPGHEAVLNMEGMAAVENGAALYVGANGTLTDVAGSEPAVAELVTKLTYLGLPAIQIRAL